MRVGDLRTRRGVRELEEVSFLGVLSMSMRDTLWVNTQNKAPRFFLGLGFLEVCLGVRFLSVSF